MKRIAVTLCLLTLASAACRKAQESDASRDEYGCRYPEHYGAYDPPLPDPDELRAYEACSKFGWFERSCKENGYTMVDGACRRIRDGRAEYSGPSPLLGDYGFSENWWIDCRPHAAPYTEPGDPIECISVEPGDDPAKLPWDCIVQPPEWCPPNP